ncbi:MAG: hypothetical protein ACUVX8_07620 [Candidatus Zipacnadales bacterium]
MDHYSPRRSHPVEKTQDLPVAPSARNSSGPPLLLLGAILVGGAIIGTVAGVLFTRWWASRYETQTLTTRSKPLPPVEAEPLTPQLLFNTTSQRPAATPEVLEAGGKEIYCFFTVPGEPATAMPVFYWLNAMGEPIKAQGRVSKEESKGLSGSVVLKPPPGRKVFQEGIYEVGLFINGESVVEGSFVLLKGAQALLREPSTQERYRPEVRNLIVSTGRSSTTAKSPFVLPAGTRQVKVTFQYAYALSGTAFTVQWLYEDGLIQQATQEVIIQSPAGQGEAWFSVKSPAVLPNGRYAVLILLSEGAPPLARQSFWVGQRPREEELRGFAR